jgi:hypothetical protein
MKKVYLGLLGVVVAIFLSMGCATPALWKDSSSDIDYMSYTETIDAFMINPNDKSMIFIGEKYHYIFEPNDQLAYLLEHRDSSMEFLIANGSYNISNDIANVGFQVAIDKTKATKQTMEWLNGQNAHNNTIYISLYGKRYNADSKINNAVQKSTKPFSITIQSTTKKTNIGGMIVKVIATPIALAVDGAIIIGAGIALIPIAISGNL